MGRKKRNMHLAGVFFFLEMSMVYFVCYNMHYFSNNVATVKGDKHCFYQINSKNFVFFFLILNEQITVRIIFTRHHHISAILCLPVMIHISK